jgi:glycosyltransferase involved in cell wall biosynthesis
LFASPFPPKESGISDYSLAQVLALESLFDITLYTDNYSISDRRLKHFNVVRHGVDRIDFDGYDFRLYQIGNNPWYHGYIYEACLRHPGTVVLHEPVLYFLIVGIYGDRGDFYSKIFEIGGPTATSAIKRQLKGGGELLRFPDPSSLPLNRELLLSGNDIVVHSEDSRRSVAAVAGSQVRVSKINHLLLESVSSSCQRSRTEVLWELGIPPDATVVASFGFVAPTKLNHVVCGAVERLNQRSQASVYYLMVGEGNYVDKYRSDRIRVTGYIPLEEFEEYLLCSDLVLNLRYPSMGETSGTALRAMAAGKPCIVTDIGWFSELPDDVVLKLGAGNPELLEEELYQMLDIFLANSKPFLRMAASAAEYVRREHAPKEVARMLYELLSSRPRVSNAHAG